MGEEEPPPPLQQRHIDPNPPPPTETHRPNSRKRPLDSSTTTTPTNAANVSRVRSNSYFKLRSLLKDLRPQFIEVLRTPDFRNSKAAQDIREKLRLLMDLYRLMVEEPVSTAKLNTFPQQAVPRRPPSSLPATTLTETKPAKRQHLPETDTRGTYIVGGSASGWNFITFPGEKPVYCGVTKESFRATRVKT